MRACCLPETTKRTAVHDDIAEVLFTEQEIADRVREMGGAITRDYADAARDGGIVLVSVLRGAAIFMADLARKIELPLEMDYMAISSYGDGAKSSGVVRILKDLSSANRGAPRHRGRRHPRLGPDVEVPVEKPELAQSRVARSGNAFAQADACAGEDRLQIRRLRMPRRVHRRVRPGLCGTLPQPALHRHSEARAGTRGAAPASVEACRPPLGRGAARNAIRAHPR